MTRIFGALVIGFGLACGGGAEPELVPPLLPYQHGKIGIYAAHGYVDAAGKVRLPAEYPYAGRHSEGLAWVGAADGSYGLLDEAGAWVVGSTRAYAHTEPFQDGVARVQDDRKRWGLVDRAGVEVVAPTWEGIAPASDGLSAAFGPDGCSYLTRTGEVLGSFARCMPFHEGLAAVAAADGGWFYVDRSMRTVVPGPFESAGAFAEGRAWVQRGVQTARDREPYGGWQLIDATGAILRDTDHTLAEAWPFSDAGSVVHTDTGYRLVAPDGSWASDRVFERARPLSDGLALVSVAGGAGYADARGDLVLPGPYEPPKDWTAERVPGDFVGGVALARPAGEGRWGVLGKDGAWIVQPELEQVEPFVDGWARAKTADRWVWVAADGRRSCRPAIDRSEGVTGTTRLLPTRTPARGDVRGGLHGTLRAPRDPRRGRPVVPGRQGRSVHRRSDPVGGRRRGRHLERRSRPEFRDRGA